MQLHRQLPPIETDSLVNLPKRGRRNRLARKTLDLALPVGAKFCNHAAAREQPSHGRRIRLKAGQLVGIFRRQGVGDGGQDLRHLHDRALQPAKCVAKIGGMFGPVDLEPEIPLAGHARGKPGHRRRHPRIAADAATDAAIVVRCHQERPSSSSIMPEIISRPIDQKAGSRGLRPKRCNATS